MSQSQMTTLKFVEEIKSLMFNERGKLINEKDALQKRFHKGVDFFLSAASHSKEEISRASDNMADIMRRIDFLTKEIYDLDLIIGTKLETFFADFEIRIQIPQRIDESGDKSDACSPLLHFTDDEMVNITPEDLWALKILKPALHYQNIKITRREK